jgi:hypothetical protein
MSAGRPAGTEVDGAWPAPCPASRACERARSGHGRQGKLPQVKWQRSVDASSLSGDRGRVSGSTDRRLVYITSIMGDQGGWCAPERMYQVYDRRPATSMPNRRSPLGAVIAPIVTRLRGPTCWRPVPTRTAATVLAGSAQITTGPASCSIGLLLGMALYLGLSLTAELRLASGEEHRLPPPSTDPRLSSHPHRRARWADPWDLLVHQAEVVPRFVELEVAVPHLSPAIW